MILLILSGLAALGILLYVTFNVVLFRITSLSPDPSRFPTSSNTLTVTFTKQLNESKKPTVTSKDIAISSTSVSKNSLTIRLGSTLEKDQKVTITLANVTASSGESLSQTITLTGTYVDYASLTPTEQQKQTQQSDSFTAYKLTGDLPIVTTDYEINYVYPDSGQTQMPIYITVKNPYPAPDASSTAADRANYNAFLKQAQEAAYARLIGLPNYNETNYAIYYSEPMLGQGIKGTYSGAVPLD